MKSVHCKDGKWSANPGKEWEKSFGQGDVGALQTLGHRLRGPVDDRVEIPRSRPARKRRSGKPRLLNELKQKIGINNLTGGTPVALTVSEQLGRRPHWNEAEARPNCSSAPRSSRMPKLAVSVLTRSVRRSHAANPGAGEPCRETFQEGQDLEEH